MRENQRKILLIEPPFYRLFKDTYSLSRYPLSLGYLAGTIKQKTDWNVVVYNADFVPRSKSIKVSYLAGDGFHNYLDNLKDTSKPIWREIKLTVAKYRPTVVGISAKTQNFRSACLIAKLVKEIDNQIIVIVGGPHPSMVGVEVLNCPDIDICVRGEGENTIVELLDAIANQKPFDNIQGIIYKKGDRVVENPPREFIKDLGSLSFPHQYASELLKDYDKYPITAFRSIFAIRGCPYNCFFCGSRKIWSRRVRCRSVENVIEEIKALQEKGLKAVHFDDDTFGVNKQYIQDLCNAIIKRCPGLKWSCELHVNLVDEPTIRLMKKSGCYSIQIGIESGNNEILKKIRKNFTIEKAISACKIIKKHKIKLGAFFMFGFPWETEDTLNDTILAMKRIPCDGVTYSIFTPYPGTEAFEFCKENRLIDDNYDISLLYHKSPINCFCLNITLERFRVLVSKVEERVDKKNSLNRIKSIFSLNTIWRVKELGFKEGLKKGINIFLGK
ncbi:tRNA-2-methylthio-N(6)-dimethylallyladenosine synthase [subsurface metagenome]